MADWRVGKGPGVFTLEQLAALGQTGDAKTDYLNRKDAKRDPNSIFATGGRRTAIPPGLPAGVYNGIPGLQDGYYYDPHSAHGVAPEFAEWANSDFKKDPITGMPTAYDTKTRILPNGEIAHDVDLYRGKEDAAGFDAIQNLISSGVPRQDAQDQVLGTGKYQRGLLDINGKYRGMPADGEGVRAMWAPPKASYFPLSTESEPKLGWSTDGGAEQKVAARAAADALDQRNAEARAGLGEQRMARGLDPYTGTSDAEKKRIWETYNKIEDPAQREAYIKYQDPGNLVPELRDARSSARADERRQVDAGNPDTYEYRMATAMGAPKGTPGQIKLTKGHKTITDAATGRETFIGGTPKKVEYTYKKDPLSDVMSRVGGGVMGALVGFMTGGPVGAGIGAYSGAGGPMSRGSLKNPGNAFKFNRGQAHFMNLQEIGTALAFAKFTGSGSFNKSKGAMGSGWTGRNPKVA